VLSEGTASDATIKGIAGPIYGQARLAAKRNAPESTGNGHTTVAVQAFQGGPYLASVCKDGGRDRDQFGDLLVANDKGAKVLAEDLAKTYPTNTMLRLYWLSTINAAIELDKANPSQALLDLETATPDDLGQAGTFISYVYPSLRPWANLPADASWGRSSSRVSEGLDHRGTVLMKLGTELLSGSSDCPEAPEHFWSGLHPSMCGANPRPHRASTQFSQYQ